MFSSNSGIFGLVSVTKSHVWVLNSKHGCRWGPKHRHRQWKPSDKWQLPCTPDSPHVSVWEAGCTGKSLWACSNVQICLENDDINIYGLVYSRNKKCVFVYLGSPSTTKAAKCCSVLPTAHAAAAAQQCPTPQLGSCATGNQRIGKCWQYKYMVSRNPFI